jgi:hypothetical protein
MKSKSRSLFVILFGVPILFVLPVAMLGASVFHAGSIDIEVYEKYPNGSSIEATLPAAVIPIALRFIPNEVLEEVRCEVGAEAPYALDVVRAAIREISRCPDGVFVDVQSADEVVVIEKIDGKMQVLVDTPGEMVRISVPLHTVSSFVSVI